MSVATQADDRSSVLATVNPKTGEPRRPWSAWLALTMFFAAAVWSVVALVRGMWISVTDFPAAAWLQAAVATEYGDPFRLLLASLVWLAAIAVASVAVIVGYYAWAGFDWTRWGGLITVGVGCLSFLGNGWAPWCLVPLGLGAALAWLPAQRSFCAAWHAQRHPEPSAPPAPAAVTYGPLPRYR